MTASDTLFQLIKSLTKSEKGHFKKFASKHIIGDKNNYMKLFEAIDGQDKYDENDIKRRLANYIFIKHLSSVKPYLNNLILKSLQVYYANSSSDSKLRNMLDQIGILYEKALYPQCIKLLTKAKKICYKYENHLQILEILDRERHLLSTVFHKKTSEEIFAEEKQILEQYKNISEYHLLNSKMFSLATKHLPGREKHDLKKVEQIIAHPLLSSAKKAFSKQAKFYYYHTHGAFFSLKGDMLNAYKWYKRLAGFMESNPEQITKRLRQYIVILNNFIIACTNFKKFDEALHTIEKLRAIPDTYSGTERMQAIIFTSSYNNELDVYLKTRHFEKGIALVGEIEQGLKQFSGKTTKAARIVFHYNIAQLYFGVGNYSNSLEWLNKILNDREVDIREDLHCIARIFNLIVHYELGNEELLEYLDRATYRFLDKRKRLYKVETAFLNFFQKTLPKIIGKKELVLAFKDLKKELEAIYSVKGRDPFERKPQGYFNLISWVDSKIVS